MRFGAVLLLFIVTTTLIGKKQHFQTKIISQSHCNHISFLSHTRINFKLNPNTANNNFTLQLDNETTLITAKIYDMLVHLILTTKEYKVDTSVLKDGLYAVKIITNKGRGIKKLVIRK